MFGNKTKGGGRVMGVYIEELHGICSQPWNVHSAGHLLHQASGNHPRLVLCFSQRSADDAVGHRRASSR